MGRKPTALEKMRARREFERQQRELRALARRLDEQRREKISKFKREFLIKTARDEFLHGQ